MPIEDERRGELLLIAAEALHQLNEAHRQLESFMSQLKNGGRFARADTLAKKQQDTLAAAVSALGAIHRLRDGA